MERLNPIYTQQRECQDCHKCIRECPVKAIRVQDGYARVVPELCIMCGNCVLACPSNAKRVRDDLPVAKALLKSGRKVIASLAPSFAAQFSGVRAARVIHALKRLGFFAVSETALGAQQVSASVFALMRSEPKQIWISSACPVVVDFIAKYHPECQPHVFSVLSPLLTHCKMLRAHYGDDIATVFIGPCIAKKKEAEQHPELLDAVLTFEDLDRWLAEENIHPEEMAETSADRFQPEDAEEGALYPIEGGMVPDHAGKSQIPGSQFMSFSGISNVEQALKGTSEWKPEHNIFLELTACAGSCVNGPKAARNTSVARRRYDIVHYAKPATRLPRKLSLGIAGQYAPSPVARNEYSELQLQEALRTVGKYSAEDELNCGGCGYDSCRDFAHALVAHNAERMMCATYTRKLAQKKANALLQKMPSAVVIVDEHLKIIECNLNFVRLFAADAEQSKDLEGSAIDAVIPFSYLFRRVLDSDEDIVSHDIRYQRSILNTSIFTIEPHSVMCGIFQDITKPIFQKEQIIGRAREVIQKNLKTVQQIAFLLGENAADSEIILNSIVRSFSPEEVDENDAGGADLTGAESFIEVESCQRAKHGQLISGDVFLSQKVKQEGRIVSVLSDGLGSGVKASVLASMTATMALKFTASAMDIRASAEIIMDTLPICSVRKISYSTFTVVDMTSTGETRIIEHGNPPFLLVRPNGELSISKNALRPKRWEDRVISFSTFDVQREDRIIFFSDGITQAGMGEFRTPLGWGLENVDKFVREKIDRYPFISARELSRLMVARAEEVDGLSAKDDITCGVVYFRSPRQLLVMTGAPFNRAHDQDLAKMAEHTSGRKVICGGTTANIISRLLNRSIQIDMRQHFDPKVPPSARMEGFDLVTEGTLTLGEVLRLLEKGFAPEDMRSNPAVRLATMFLDSDIVKFAVGTRINEAHQDPNIPVELDLRRNIVKRIAQLLESKHMKRVLIQYL